MLVFSVTYVCTQDGKGHLIDSLSNFQCIFATVKSWENVIFALLSTG